MRPGQKALKIADLELRMRRCHDGSLLIPPMASGFMAYAKISNKWVLLENDDDFKSPHDPTVVAEFAVLHGFALMPLRNP